MIYVDNRSVIVVQPSSTKSSYRNHEVATSVWKVKVLRIIGKTSPVLCTMVFAVCMHGSCFLQGERIERGIRVCCVACLRRHIWLLYACGKYVMVHCCSVVFLSILVHQLLYRYELFNVLYLDFNLVPTKMRHHFADILIVNEITTTSRQTVCVCVCFSLSIISLKIICSGSFFSTG